MKTAKEWSADYYSADSMELLIEVIQKDAQQELLEACKLTLPFLRSHPAMCVTLKTVENAIERAIPQ